MTIKELLKLTDEKYIRVNGDTITVGNPIMNTYLKVESIGVDKTYNWLEITTNNEVNSDLIEEIIFKEKE